MKRLCILLTVVFLLTGCTQADPQEIYTVERDGIIFTVDPEAHTITDGKDVYIYKVTANSTTITYPDGRYFTWTYNEHGATGTGNRLENGNVSNRVLVSIAEEAAPRKASGKSHATVLATVIVALFGVIAAVFPKASWYLSYGWRFKNAEPSEAALILARVSGILVAVVSVFLLFII